METLKDPKNDRMYNSLPLPPSVPLLSSFIWDNIEKPSKDKKKSQIGKW